MGYERVRRISTFRVSCDQCGKQEEMDSEEVHWPDTAASLGNGWASFVNAGLSSDPSDERSVIVCGVECAVAKVTATVRSLLADPVLA